jgi:hypothetical protein
MMKCKSTGRIASETTKNNNRETNEEEPLTELVNNVSSFNNYEDETYNGNTRQTSKEEAVTEPVNNVCTFNCRTGMKHTMAIELACTSRTVFT